MLSINIRQTATTLSQQALSGLYTAHRIIGTQVPGQDAFGGRFGRALAPSEPPTIPWGMAYNDRRVFEPMRYRAHPDGPAAPWYLRPIGHFAQSVADVVLSPFIILAAGYGLCTGGMAGARQVLEHQGLGVCLTRGVMFGCMVGAGQTSRSRG